MVEETYGHTLPQRMFDLGDVYGIGHDEERAARRRLRLGVIGAGGVAQSKHLPAINRLRTLWEPVDVVAIAEPDTRQGEKVAALYGCRLFRSPVEMLAAAPLDGVLVTSPDHLHIEHASLAVEAGIPALVEKPLARDLEAGRALCRTAEGRGVLLMAVANKRFSPPYRRAARLIREGAIGTTRLLLGKFNLGYDNVDLLEDGTIHLFDLALHLMGPVSSVFASHPRPAKRAGIVDTVAMTLEFASGAVGNLTTTAMALSLKPWERVEVYGDGRWLAVDDQFELVVHDSETGPTKSWRPVVPNTLLFDEEFGGYCGQVENFLQAIRGLEPPAVTGWDGYRACVLVDAVHRSLGARATVAVTDAGGDGH